MTQDDDPLELRALQALGIVVPTAPAAPAPDEGALDALVRAGHLARHQALAARAWVARRAVTCACGRRWVGGEPCPACGATLGSRPAVVAPLPAARSPGASPGSSGSRGLAAALGPGARVGPLLLHEELGRGAAGVVFRAVHEELQRECALKVVPGATRDERRRRRFANEVEALARLVHPGIVKVHAVHELPGALAVEMELVRGRTLEERVHQGGPLRWRDAARLVAQLGRAVAHAHGLGVLHRDLKPENVLVRDEDGSAVVADFGLTRLEDQSSSLTTAGALLGTPLYMAPEAYEGEFTPRTDIYGLGAILYQALAGKPPFQADSPASLQYKVATGQVAPLDAPGLPPELERIRARAMAPDPARRYAAAADLATDLERLLRGERTSVSRATWPALARRRRGLLLGLGLGALAVALTALLLRPGGEPPPPPPLPPPEGLAGALAVAGGASAGSERWRESALLRLRAACAPGHPEQPALAASIDSALAAAPEPAPLRRVRAQLHRATGAPLRAEDLAALAGGELADVDPLALHALERGTVPELADARALVAVRSLAAAHPGSRGARALLGVALCASGDPEARPEAASALFDPPPPAGARRAERLAATMRLADELAEELETGGETPHEGQELAAAVEALLAEPGLERAPAVVLARIARAIPIALRSGRLVDHTRPLLRTAAVRALHAGRPALAPGVRALEVLACDLLDEAPPWWRRPRAAEQRAWAAELAQQTPLLGAAAMQLALRSELEREAPPDEPAAQRLLAEAEAIEAVLARAPRGTMRSGTDEALELRTRHRLATDRAVLERRRWELDPAAPTAPERLSRALTWASRALAISDEHHMNWRTVTDLQLVARLGLQVPDLEVVRSVAPRMREGPALEAELLRRGGRAQEAKALACERLASPSLASEVRSDLLAVQALAEVDLGQLEDARSTLAGLRVELAKADPDVLADAWTPASVQAYLEARAPR